MTTALVIHGHFYQPPRENPWTNIVEREPSAHPFPNWNARILSECYRPNAFARIVDGFNRIERIVNNYGDISFNFGPTLHSWIAANDPRTNAHILLADRESALRFGGHGNAIAQAYNHAILPLCNARDLLTQVRWGIADFRFRFGREPEAMWLPETACNEATLGVLIDHGMKFAILSPYQAWRVRPIGGETWQDVSDGRIDSELPYRFPHPDGSGRSLALFFYNGAIAQAVAFQGGLSSSQALLSHFRQARGGEGRIVHVATDGESYGHHTKFGDRALAHALEVEVARNGFHLTNYGQFLEHHPPRMEVELKPGPNGEGTSWSCAHGVGRWCRDCGCSTGGKAGWRQEWRAPLRAAFDFLRDAAARVFESEGGELFRDPWAARDAYLSLVLQPASREAFLREQARHALSEEEQVRALTLLEIQRHALLMYTSCGWFFNDLSGLETLQVMKYAGRVLDRMEEIVEEPPRKEFLEILAQAKSNIPEMGNGAEIFQRQVDPLKVTSRSIAAHLGISALVDGEEEEGSIAAYHYTRQEVRRGAQDRLSLVTCRLVLTCERTGRRHDYAVAAMHFGGIDFYCLLKPYPGSSRFRAAAHRLWSKFESSTLPVILREAERDFGPDEYGLTHVLPEGRRRIAGKVFRNLIDQFTERYARLYEDNRHSIEMLQNAGFELPAELLAAAEFTLGRRFEAEIRDRQYDPDPQAYQKALEIAEQVSRRGYHLQSPEASQIFEGMIAEAIEKAAAPNDDQPERVQRAHGLVQLSRRLGLNPNLERAQEILYDALVHQRVPVSQKMRHLALAMSLAPKLLDAIAGDEAKAMASAASAGASG